VKLTSSVAGAGLAASLAVYAAALAAPPARPTPTATPAPKAGGAMPSHAIAVLQSGASGKVAGTIHFHKQPAGVHVQGRITGLTSGAHGFHIHEFGDCSAADFTSAGSHFNPTNEPHGARTDAKRHVGDMGNIDAGADGSATVDYTDNELRFDGMRSILGRGVIVHEKADDFKTQPTGNAGGRLACGVVGVAKPE
jgi:Cu-Zn family superoxide dismutase